MKECKISHKDFNGIFTQRTFSKRDVVMKTIYFVEDCDGNYKIEERNSSISKLVAAVLFVPLLVLSTLWFGFRSVPEYFREAIGGFTDKNCRSDTCYHGVESTIALVKLAGWDY